MKSHLTARTTALTLIFLVLAIFSTTLSSAIILDCNAVNNTGGYGSRNGHNKDNTAAQLYGMLFTTTTGSGFYDIESITFGGNRMGSPPSSAFVEVNVYNWGGSYPVGNSLRKSQPILNSEIPTNNSRRQYNFTDNSTTPFTDGNTYIAVISSNWTTSGINVLVGGSCANLSGAFKNDGDSNTTTWTTTGAPFLSLNNDLDFKLITRTSATPPVPPINFVIQNPTNITSQTLFSQTATQSYNYTNISFTNQKLKYTLTRTTGDNCLTYINGTCTYTNGNQGNITPSTWTNHTTSQIINYSLTENAIYPSNANLPSSNFSQTHTNNDLTSNNHLFWTELQNITSNTTTYNILEVMANTTGESLVYACNSTYSTGLIYTSPYCAEIGRINTTGYNHTHTGGYSSHNLIPFIITNGKINNLISLADNKAIFIIRGPNTGTTQAWRIPENSRTGATKTSINTGATWSTQTYSLDLHLHSYTGSETLNTTATGNWTTSILNSTTNSELIDLTGTAPTIPHITNPLQTRQETRYFNISWTQSFPTIPTSKIQNYTLFLLNSDLSLNATLQIFNNATYSYYWNTYEQNLSTGTYYIRVLVNDTFGATNQDTEQLNITKNAELNLTLKSATNSTTLTNATINITRTGNTTETWNATTNQTIIDIIKSATYNITIDKPGYSLYSQDFTSNTTNLQYLNISLYTNNSISITIYNENTGLIITENITITFTGTYEQINSTTTGTFYIDNLPDGTWTIKFQGTNYSLKQYTATIGSRSHQELSAYLTATSQNTIFTILDFDSAQVIEGATITQQRLINSTWTTIDTKNSDITGRAQLSYTPSIKYRFLVVATGYQSSTFELNPVLFSSYNIRLTKTTTLSPPTTPPYTDISIVYYPTNFTNEANHTLTWVISSPGGQLLNYNLSITYPGTGSPTYDTGTNLYGETLTKSFVITGANISSRVIISYCWNTTTSYNTCRVYTHTIAGNYGNYTFNKNIDRTYGLGLFERVLIATLLILFIGGGLYAFLNPLAGLVVILFLTGFFYYIGFLSLWLILPGTFIGLLIIFRGDKNG